MFESPASRKSAQRIATYILVAAVVGAGIAYPPFVDAAPTWIMIGIAAAWFIGIPFFIVILLCGAVAWVIRFIARSRAQAASEEKVEHG